MYLGKLSEEFIKQRQGDGGKVLVTLKYPDIIPIMSNCHVAASRQKVQDAREQAYDNNLELMAQGVQKRKTIANMLGFDSYAGCWNHDPASLCHVHFQPMFTYLQTMSPVLG